MVPLPDVRKNGSSESVPKYGLTANVVANCLQLGFCANGCEVSNLWLKCAHRIGGGVDDVDAKLLYAKWIGFEMRWKFADVRVESDTQCRIICSPCRFEFGSEAHEYLCVLVGNGDGASRAQVFGKFYFCSQ